MEVVVNMACGLANRMFQYSYYLYLKELGYDVEVDFYRAVKLPHENVPWGEIFPDAPICQASSGLVFKLGGGSGLISKVRRRLPFFNKVMQMSTAFDISVPVKSGSDKYVIGVFQNARMVEMVKNVVQQSFAFTPFEEERNLELMHEMQACQSVAIHVRKGNDYMQRHWYKGTCPVEYYQKAVALMRGKLERPVFYVFTDNAAWVKEHFNAFEYKLVEGNPAWGWGAHFDMQLMSCCHHNIISNSTYSWWGAFLNGNPKKIVVGPALWFNPDSCEMSTSELILCKGWIAL